MDFIEVWLNDIDKIFSITDLFSIPEKIITYFVDWWHNFTDGVIWAFTFDFIELVGYIVIGDDEWFCCEFIQSFFKFTDQILSWCSFEILIIKIEFEFSFFDFINTVFIQIHSHDFNYLVHFISGIINPIVHAWALILY